MIARISAFTILLAVLMVASAGENPKALGINLERYEYPFPVKWHDVPSPEGALGMAYMDVPATGELKGTCVLLHGKNFSGAYWEQTARDLSELGYRVIIPDQIGFGKSTKPESYQFSFHGLAANTKALLDELEVEEANVLGHSMGGMLATRFAVMYPDTTSKLVLVNPIGLEDWAAKGVPYRGLQAWYERELNKTAEGIKEYQLESYYDGDWQPAYQEWVDLLVGMVESENYARLARVQAQTYDMIYSQPVVADFPQIQSPTLLVIGDRDRTALGKDLVSDELREELGDYPELALAAQESISNSHLELIEDVGHLPHIEAYPQFIEPLKQYLAE